MAAGARTDGVLVMKRSGRSGVTSISRLTVVDGDDVSNLIFVIFISTPVQVTGTLGASRRTQV